MDPQRGRLLQRPRPRDRPRNDSTGDLTIWAGRGDTTFGSPAKLTAGW
ncbi:hypothetical protein [Streptomyces sp. NRRL F-2664]|nr:hypothetical protein [Streptomyces sp. NRRL F-2664]